MQEQENLTPREIQGLPRYLLRRVVPDGEVEHEFAIPLPFFVVDAAMLEVFRESPTTVGVRLDYRRTSLSTGSVEYYLFGTGKDEKRLRLGTVFICAQDDHLTYINASPLEGFSDKDLDAIQDTLNTIVYVCMQELSEHQAYTRNLLETMVYGLVDNERTEPQLHLSMTSGPTRTGAHSSWPEDDWAWEQVNLHHRPRMEVREEWLQRLSPDRTLRDKPGSFRHAVNRKRKGIRKAGT